MSFKSKLQSFFSSTRIEVKCPKCGTIISPKNPALAREILKKGMFIVMKCHKCGTEIQYDN